MKIICTQKNLKRGLALVGRVATRSAHLPILENILLQASGGVLTLLATNLEIGVSCIVPCKVESEGSFTLPASLLNSYIGLQSGERVELELIDNIMHVSCGESKTSIKGIDAQDFPLMPEVKGKNHFVIKSETLKDILSRVLFSIVIDENRPEISGIFLRMQENTITFVGTDSYRLAEYKHPIEKSELENFDSIVPLRAVQELQRILPDENSDVTVTIADNQISFKLNESELVTRLIEGKFPDYNQIIPSQTSIRCEVETQKFSNLIKTASLFSKQGINDVRISIIAATKELVITSNNGAIGENMSTMKANEVEGEDIDIVFNYRYILDILPTLGDTVIFHLNNGNSPAIIRSKELKDKYLYLVMPIRQ